MPRPIEPPPGQPDLFVRSPAELRAELRRHGGGTPPRHLAPAPDMPEEASDFSPVQIAERERAIRQLTGVVPIRVVRFDNLLSYVERRGML